jgi:hypothetical protein
VTFGQPRIGNSVFATYYNNFVPKTIRVTHEHDIVPHLPPYYTYFPQRTYHHFPREVCYYDQAIAAMSLFVLLKKRETDAYITGRHANIIP